MRTSVKAMLTIDQAADVVDAVAPYLGGNRYHRAVCSVQRGGFVVGTPHFTFSEEADGRIVGPIMEEGGAVPITECTDEVLVDRFLRTAISIGQ